MRKNSHIYVEAVSNDEYETYWQAYLKVIDEDNTEIICPLIYSTNKTWDKLSRDEFDKFIDDVNFIGETIKLEVVIYDNDLLLWENLDYYLGE